MGFSDARLAKLTGCAGRSGDAKAPRARRAAGVQAHRHLRGRVRLADRLHVFDLRGAVRRPRRRRGAPSDKNRSRHPRRRAEPHRPGHRVRLLLLPCRLRAEGGRLRNHHDQLQSGDGVDRLRHLRPALLRAADREDVLEIIDTETTRVRPVFKRIDTCAAEFASPTAYMYSTYEAPFAGRAVDEAAPSDKKKVMILGGGPNRIGQGIEFDYCCCHAAFALKDAGYETIMVNCNPETVSTDYDTVGPAVFRAADRRGRARDHRHRARQRHAARRHRAVRRPDAAQARRAAGTGQVPILGTSPDAIDLAEDRDRFKQLLDQLEAAAAEERHRHQPREGARHRRGDRLSDRDPAVLRARRPRHGDRARRRAARPLSRPA